MTASESEVIRFWPPWSQPGARPSRASRAAISTIG